MSSDTASTAVHNAKAKMSKLEVKPLKDSSAFRMNAISKWRALGEEFHEHCELGRLLMVDLAMGLEHRATQSLQDVIEPKSIATLSGRIGPLRRHVFWSKKQRVRALPLTESGVYSCINSMRSERCAATAVAAFWQSLNFAFGMMG